MGIMIGSGIFLMAGSIAQHLTSIAAVIGVWGLGGLLTLTGALSLAELGAAFPAAGAPYVIAEEAFGRVVAFLSSWVGITLINSGAIATLAAAVGFYAGPLLGLHYTGQKLLQVLTIAFFTLINCLGVTSGKRVQNTLTVLKMFGLASVVAVLYIMGSAAQIRRNMFLPGNGGFHLTAVGGALAAVLWAYDGWSTVSFNAGEIRDPGRTLPRALVIGVAMTTGIYVVANVAYYAVLSPEAIRGTGRVASLAVQHALGPQGGLFISILIIVSILGTINGNLMGVPRLPYAMAKDGLFFRQFARVSRKTNVPVVATVAQGALAILFTLVGTFQQLFSSYVFLAWITYGLLGVAVLVLRKRQPDLERPFRCPLYPITPIFFVLASLAFLITEFVANFWQSMTGIGLLLTGIPMYFLFRYLERNRQPEVGPST